MTVSATLIVPYVTLAVLLPYICSQTLNVLSSISLPSCAGNIRPQYKFSWKVYKGIKYIQSLVSTSKDPNVFKLAPYALDVTSETYLIQLEVSSPKDAFAPILAITQVSVTPAGVKAVITGGSSVVINYKKTLTLDASSSLDLNMNSPTEASELSYQWTCSQTAPNLIV